MKASRLFCLALASLCVSTAGVVGAQDHGFADLDDEVRRQCGAGEFEGLVALQVAGQTAYYFKCGDQTDPTARYKIFSTSKLLTALAVMSLIEDGKMELDAPLSRYLPDAPGNWSAVTIRHLLNHTSGLGDHSNELMGHFGPDHAIAMRSLLRQRDIVETRPATPPGAAWRYNNFGYELLAYAAAQADGRSFDKVLADRVFAPAGMKTALAELGGRKGDELASQPDPLLAPGWNREDADSAREPAVSYGFVQLGAGAVHATLEDMIALDRAIRESRIVSAETWAAMLDAAVPMSAANPGAFYGLGVMISERGGLPSHGHNGGTNGYISSFRRFPEQDAVLIALFNTGWSGSRWIEDAAGKALAERTTP